MRFKPRLGHDVSVLDQGSETNFEKTTPEPLIPAGHGRKAVRMEMWSGDASWNLIIGLERILPLRLVY